MQIDLHTAKIRLPVLFAVPGFLLLFFPVQIDPDCPGLLRPAVIFQLKAALDRREGVLRPAFRVIVHPALVSAADMGAHIFP